MFLNPQGVEEDDIRVVSMDLETIKFYEGSYVGYISVSDFVSVGGNGFSRKMGVNKKWRRSRFALIEQIQRRDGLTVVTMTEQKQLKRCDFYKLKQCQFIQI